MFKGGKAGMSGQDKGFGSNYATVFNLIPSQFHTWFSYEAAKVCACVWY